MSRLQAIEETYGFPLFRMSPAMASGHGQNVCAPIWAAEVPRDVCLQLELRHGMGWTTRLAQRAITEPHSYAKERQKAEGCEDTSAKPSGRWKRSFITSFSFGPQFWERSTITASSNASYAMAWLRHEPAFDDAASNAAHAHYNASPCATATIGTDGTNGTAILCAPASPDRGELGTDGVHRDGEGPSIGAAGGHETSNANDVKERGGQGNERSPLGGEATWDRESRGRRGDSGTHQFDCVLEKLPHGGCQDMAGLHRALSNSGERPSVSDPRGPGAFCPSQSTGSRIASCCWQTYNRDQGRGRGHRGWPRIDGFIVGENQRGTQDAFSVITADEGASRRHRGGGECGQTAENRKPSYGRHMRIFQAAFCLARLSMTFTYDSLGLCRHWSSDASALTMKWHNRALLKDDFVSEWKARELAMGLAGELSHQSDATSSPWRTSWSSSHDDRQTIPMMRPLSRKSRSGSLHVGFAESVDVWIGCEDSFQMYHSLGSLGMFASRASPWSCPDFDSATSSHRTFDLIATTDSSRNVAVRSLNPHPTWAGEILELLQREGQQDDDDDDLVLYITSYFIDHAGHPHHDQPRLLRFDSAVSEWERDICLIWEDHIDVSIPFDVTLVTPDTPHNVYPDAVATAIVHQRATFANAATLLTTVHIADPVTRFTECAHSFPRQVDTNAVLHAAQVATLCQDRLDAGFGACTVHTGHLHLQEGHLHQLHHGLGLQIRVPPALTDDELEQNFERRVRQRQLLHPPHMWNPPQGDAQPETTHPRHAASHGAPEDESSFMARSLMIHRPAGETPQEEASRSSRTSRSYSSTSPSSSSSTSEAEDWRQTVIFSLDGRSLSLPLPWHDQAELYRLAAREFDITSLDIIRLHLVMHRPLDYIQVDLHGLLIQKVPEYRPTPFERLVLLDVELHVNNDAQPTPFRRYVRWLPYTINRPSLFGLLGLDQVLQDYGDLSYLWKNHVIILRSDTSPMNILDGDYIKIYVGEADIPDQCISESDMIVEDDLAPSENSDELSSLFQRSVIQSHRAFHNFGKQLGMILIKTDPTQIDQGGHLAPHLPRTPTLPRTVFHRGFHHDDQRRLSSLFEREAFVECEEEGRVAYLETWYIHHDRHRHCREARAIKLHDNPQEWAEEILALWDLQGDLEADVILHLVQPTPPCTRFQCVLGHVIVEHAPQPEKTVGILSIDASDQRGSSLEHEAHSLEDFMGRNMVLRKAELDVFCQTRICTVSLGALPFGLVDIEEVPRAVCLTIHIRPVLLYNADNDFMDLMQRTPSTVRWRRQRAPQAGNDLSSAPARCDGTAFNFNPNAPAFNPAEPFIGYMPENVQDLHQAWQRTAFSWEGESASTSVITWFVDQHNAALHHCQVPRIVRLFANFDQWEVTFRQAWHDFALPGAPIMIHVVTPPPSNLDQDHAAHVILIQNPLDQFSSSLITGFDSTAPNPGHPVFQLAMTTMEILHYDHLIMALGLGGRCLYPGSPAQCSLRYGQHEIIRGVPFPARDGHGLTVRITPRPTFQTQGIPEDGPVLLQLDALIHNTEDSERLTTASVAHEQWPLPSEPPIPFESSSVEETMGIQLISGCSTLVLPAYIECACPGTAQDIQNELQTWGIDCQAFRFGPHWKAFCLPRTWHSAEQAFHYMFFHQDVTDEHGTFVHTDDHELSQVEIMRVLHQLGHFRAAVLNQETCHSKLYIVEFLDVVQQPWDHAVPGK